VAGTEGANGCGQQPRPGAGEGSQAQPTGAGRCQVGEVLGGMLEARADRLGVSSQHLPGVGGDYPAGAAHHQRNPGGPFERGDLLGYR
jgi:hypothetical protein